MDNIRIAEGFRGQILHTLPRPAIDAGHPLMQALHITDTGWYPEAKHHFRERPRGADENILILCVNGAGWFEIKGCRSRLGPGQALVIPQGVPHLYEADPKTPWSIHWMHFKGNDAGYYMQLLPDNQYSIPVSSDCMTALESIFKAGYTAILDSYSSSNILYLAQLAHHLLGQLFYHNRAYSPELRAPASHDLQATLTHILEHCTEPITRSDLARHAGLSVAHFSALFKRQTGVSPIQYLIEQRMRRACRLLDTTCLTIREIAAQTGYDDPYYFSRLFSQTIGHSPRQYRHLRKG